MGPRCLWRVLATALVGAPCLPAAREPAQYDEAEARLFLQYARVAFCDQASIEGWTCGDICEAAPVVQGTPRFLAPGVDFRVQGYLAVLPDALPSAGAGGTPALVRHPGAAAAHAAANATAAASAGPRCVLAFRGSVEASNWLADAEAWRTPWPPVRGRGPLAVPWCAGCEAHHGFAASYEELRPNLLAALTELRCASVAVTGHSLGAAVGSLATLDLRAELKMEVGPAYLFGAPRPGNPALAAAFAAAGTAQGASPASWRIVHWHDAVPRLPPSSADYQHVSQEVYYTEAENEYRVCSADGEDPTCSLSTPVWRCITFDHLTYLNLTMRHSRLPKACIGAPLDWEGPFHYFQ